MEVEAGEVEVIDYPWNGQRWRGESICPTRLEVPNFINATGRSMIFNRFLPRWWNREAVLRILIQNKFRIASKLTYWVQEPRTKRNAECTKADLISWLSPPISSNRQCSQVTSIDEWATRKDDHGARQWRRWGVIASEPRYLHPYRRIFVKSW